MLKIKTIISLFTAFALLANHCYADQDVTEKEVNEYPSTCQEAVDLILNNLDEQNRGLLLSISKDDLKNKRFLTGWGKGIRDGFGINEGNFALIQSCQALRDDAILHPVNTSMIIMEEVWLALRQ